jgi:hypothetical protein
MSVKLGNKYDVAIGAVRPRSPAGADVMLAGAWNAKGDFVFN